MLGDKHPRRQVAGRDVLGDDHIAVDALVLQEPGEHVALVYRLRAVDETVQSVLFGQRKPQDASQDLLVVLMQTRERARRRRHCQRLDEALQELGLAVSGLGQRRAQMDRQFTDTQWALLNAQQPGAHELRAFRQRRDDLELIDVEGSGENRRRDVIGAQQQVEQLREPGPVTVELEDEQLALDLFEAQQVGDPGDVLFLHSQEFGCLPLRCFPPRPHGSLIGAVVFLDEREHTDTLQIKARKPTAGVIAELALQVLEGRQQLLGNQAPDSRIARERPGSRNRRRAGRVEEGEQMRVGGEHPSEALVLCQTQRPSRHLMRARRFERIVSGLVFVIHGQHGSGK